ncbi:MFS transporter [Bradyrhizobium sp. ARR65]|uniref:MFS transporter n=1 Tax=Bradyrhizobium sp. ARR65 TaxID=1040989 RepID=UPI0007C468B7|nr:MFS transporter [Bradyrhizobium sp. ARR65]
MMPHLSQASIVRVNGPTAYIILYACMYAAFGAASPFWPKFFEAKALLPEEIGFVVGAAMLVRLAAGPFIGRIADRWGSLRLVLATCAVLAAATAMALSRTDTFWRLLLIALVQAAALAPMTSVADALSVNSAKPQLASKPFEYGWIRASGSAAFAIGVVIVGQLISRDNLKPIIWTNVTLLAAAGGATALLPSANTPSQLRPPTDLVGLGGLLTNQRYRTVIIVSALVYGSHAMHDAFAVIRWSDAGIDTSVIGTLWAEAVGAEVMVFSLFGPALVGRLGVHGAAALSALAGIVRWSIAGVSTSVMVLSIVQPLHGLTFALLHLACMRTMSDVVPSNLSATAQAFYAFGSGLLTAGLTILSGTLYASYGGASFFFMAALCGAALPLVRFGLAE